MSIHDKKDQNLLLLRSLLKLRHKDLFDLPSLNFEITLVHQLLQRNTSQHCTRKYFRLSTQVHKRCSYLTSILEPFKKDFDATCLKLKDSSNNPQSFHCLLLKSRNLLEETSKIMGLSVKALFELQRYLANCEFVKFIITLISVISNIHYIISKANKVSGKIINLLSHHDPCHSTKDMANHSSSDLFTVFEDVINDANSNAGLQYWTEAKEDLGEIVTEEKHACKPNKALYPVQTELALNLVHNMAPSTVENSLFQYNAMSNAKESKADFIVGELSDKITCDVSLCETPGKKKTFIRRKPAYKVYKERHPFIRKLARYSSDMLRREIPDYSFSLYVSL